MDGFQTLYCICLDVFLIYQAIIPSLSPGKSSMEGPGLLSSYATRLGQHSCPRTPETGRCWSFPMFAIFEGNETSQMKI